MESFQSVIVGGLELGRLRKIEITRIGDWSISISGAQLGKGSWMTPWTDADGSALIFSAYLGGSGAEEARRIARAMRM